MRRAFLDTRPARAASLGAVLLATAMAGPGAARAHHVAGATYNGTHAQGGSVSFTVTPDGSGVSSFSVGGPIQGDTCSFPDGSQATYNQPLPITDHAFSDTTPPLTIAGTFPGSQSASGTLRIKTASGGPYTPSCDSGDIAWNATTTAQPPSEPPPGGGSSAGDTSGGGSPPPAPSGQVKVSAPATERLAAVLADGLRVSVSCPGSCSVVSELLLAGTTARRLGLAARSVVVGRGTATRSQAGTAKLRVRLKAKAKRRFRGLSRVRLTLRTKVKDSTGRTRTFTRRVTLRRKLSA